MVKREDLFITSKLWLVCRFLFSVYELNIVEYIYFRMQLRTTRCYDDEVAVPYCPLMHCFQSFSLIVNRNSVFEF